MALLVWAVWFAFYITASIFFAAMHDTYASILMLGASAGWSAYGLLELTRSRLRK